MFSHPEFDNHEAVVHFNDKESGLKAIIAIHNTTLGPALGGCRMYDYASEQEALTDVLRLSKGMTYKSALAGLRLGGGKSVIIGNPYRDKSRERFQAFAEALDGLSGRYIVAEDAGTCVEDLLYMSRFSNHVAGIREHRGLDGKLSNGDPSPATALGVFTGIKTALFHQSGSDQLEGVKVAIQGLGKVGMRVARYLHDEGATLFVADVDENAISFAKKELQATVMDSDRIHAADVDIFAPCAMGASVNDRTITEIRARIIAGAANNQLMNSRHGELLHKKGILYAPDYAINAGGIIDIFHEREGSEPAVIKRHVESISDTLTEIFNRSEKENLSTAIIADKMAEERLMAGKPLEYSTITESAIVS